MRNFDNFDNVVGGNNYSNVAILVYFLSVLPDEVTPEMCLFWGSTKCYTSAISFDA